MEFSGYLDDGYTQPGYIAQLEGFHAALRFTFRPCLPEEYSRLLDVTKGTSSQKYDQASARLIASKVKTWTLCDSKGNPVDVSEAAILRLRPVLLQSLRDIVLGNQPTGIDPEWNNGEAAEEYTTVLEHEEKN